MDYEGGHSGQKDLLGAEAWGGKCRVCFATTRPALELQLRALTGSSGAWAKRQLRASLWAFLNASMRNEAVENH